MLKNWGRTRGRSESLIKPRDSFPFSPGNGFRASVGTYLRGVERRNSVGGLPRLPAENPTPNTAERTPAVRTWGISFTFKRETTHRRPRPPKRRSVAKEVIAVTAGMLGLEAATISKVRNSLPTLSPPKMTGSVVPQSRNRKIGRRASPAAVKLDRMTGGASGRVLMPERVTTRRVGSPSAESTRFPGEGQSAQGQSGPKASPRA